MSDLISRKAAVDAALTFIVEYCGAAFDEDMQKMLCERLDALPSAEPKHGHWVPLFNGEFTGGVYWFGCSECREIVPGGLQSGNYFCKGCGADMREK